MSQTDPPSPRPERDWTTEAADRIESIVTTVRDKTTRPIQKLAAVLVYGLVAAVVGIAALILLIAGLLRLHVYLPYHPEGRRVWTAYMALGAIFCLGGAFSWRSRRAKAEG